MAIVYKLINLVNMKTYIGATTQNLSTRMSSHKHSAFTALKESELYKAIREFGWENFVYNEIEQCGVLSMYEREEYWIKELNTMWPNGYNTESSNLKSSDDRRTFQSEIVKAKKSKAQKLRFSDEKERKRQSLRMKRMFKNQDFKEKHRLSLIDSWTEERRQEYREKIQNNENLINAKGYLISKENCSKSIELFDNETKNVLTFDSAKDACRFLKVSLTTVSQSIYRKSFILKRYLAKYKNDKTTFNELINQIEEKKSESFLNVSLKRQGTTPVNKKEIKLIHPLTKEEIIFKSVTDAAKYLNKQTTNVTHACKEKGRLVGGYLAEYIIIRGTS